MNPIKNSRKYAILFLCWGVSLTFAVAASYPSTREDVLVTATASKIDESNLRVSCTIENKSKYSLVSLNRGSNCASFQFRLISKDGEIIPMEKKWAEQYAQKGSYRYDHPRYFIDDVILPGDKIDFSFNLGDAYGLRVKSGQVLEISWENVYPGEEVEIGGRPSPSGQISALHKEQFHFPKEFNLGVSLPIEINNSQDAGPLSDPKANVLKPDDQAKEGTSKESKIEPLPAISNFSWPFAIGIGISIAAILGIILFLAASHSRQIKP